MPITTSSADSELVKQTMAALLVEARAGDAAAAVMTAMLVHLYPEIAADSGTSTQYEWLLAQSLQSKDPELLACLGEELLKGRLLATDAKRAHKALMKSDELSGFMGAYVIGRLAALGKNAAFAIKNLRKARLAGHIPSAALEHRLVSKRIPLVGIFVKWWFTVFDFLLLWKAIRFKEKKRLWRALDFWRSKGASKEFQELVGGPDRVNPFMRIDAILSSVSEASPNKALQSDVARPAGARRG
jgi:hypothetical protein